MKKILTLLMSLCMICAFATACNKKADNNSFFGSSGNKTEQGGDKTPDVGGDDEEEDGDWSDFY